VFKVEEQRAFFPNPLLPAGGDEVVVRFHNLRVRRPEDLLLLPADLRESQKTWPLVRALRPAVLLARGPNLPGQRVGQLMHDN
jgi:hypothetical protein